jgi:hypothetical protein
MSTRAMMNRDRESTTPLIPLGSHFTLTYRQLDTAEEHYSSVMEILAWIEAGPILQPPPITPPNETDQMPITTPSYVPASLQYVPTRLHTAVVPAPMTAVQRVYTPTIPSSSHLRKQSAEQRVSNQSEEQRVLPQPLRRSTRTTRASAFITSARTRAADFFKDFRHRPPTPFRASSSSSEESDPVTDTDITYDLHRPRSFFVTNAPTPTHGPSPHEIVLPPTELRPCYPDGPLNLNPDGTPINFRKSHAGPKTDYWLRADAEEFERLFRTGTLQPLLYVDIPPNNVVTYFTLCASRSSTTTER